MAEIEVSLQDLDQLLQNVRENRRQTKFEAKVAGEINLRDYRNALVTSDNDQQKETEEVARRLDETAQTVPLTNQNACLMPVLVTSTAIGSCKMKDYSSLLSFMLRQPLHPNWRSRAGGKLDEAPGQQLCEERRMRIALNPDSPLNRDLLLDKYGIRRPLALSRQSGVLPGKPVTGPTVDHLTMPPRANRLNPKVALPPIPEEDARKGIYSLMERCWIPPATNVTLNPSPVVKSRMKLHRFDDKFSAHVVVPGGTRVYAGVVDRQEDKGGMVPLPPIPPGAPKSSPRASNVVKTVEARVPIGLPPVQRSAMATAAATTEEEVGSATDSFVMEQGRVCETRPDFVAFKQRHAHDWGRIVPILRQLEKLLTKYAVPCATILGDRLTGLSATCQEEERKVTEQELYSVMENREEVEAIVSQPWSLFRGPGREALAALKIQTTYRRHRDQANYQQYRRLKRTVRVIEEFWGRMQQRARIRQRLQQTVAAQLERFRERAKVFAESWEQIRTSKRVVIHVPSLGYRQDVREKVMHFGVRQNTQMARLCEINDPNVDVIYVSPVPLSEETLQYYNRLLGLAGAVESGRVEDQCDLSHRYKVLVPEAVTAFQPNWMSLSTLLKYSPRTLTRIATLIRGRVAYMVTGLPHPDDAAVSDALDVPVLCPEPQVAGHCSSKSGARGLFQAAGIRVPPGEGDILRLEQLHESLTQLVLDNLNVRLWLLKLNEELDGRGIARCEVTAHLTCFPWLQEEAERYGHNWAHRWAQEKAFNKVLAEIPGILQKWAIPTDAYKSWDLFLLTFLSQGGIIEAFPPTPDVTVLTANFLLEPGGAMKLLMAGDQIHSESPPLRNWGLSLPQCSLEPMVLNNMGRRLARVCRALGVVGYLKVDLVTFVDPQMLDTVVWALDLHLGYSDSLALFRFAGYLTLGQFHARNHTFTMPVRGTEHPQRPVHEGGKTRYGYCVMSSQLVHSNLALLQLPVFFRLCRAYGIGFDVQEKNGTLFTLIDSINRDQIGMITIGESLKNALATFARQLCKIHEEVSTPKMQGISNFKGALQDIESILSLIQQNIDKHTEQENRQQVQEE